MKIKSAKNAVILGTSLRRDGAMGFQQGFFSISAKRNRAAFFRSLGIDPSQVVFARLAHGTKVFAVRRHIRGERTKFSCDAMVTNVPGIFLAITTADCFPVFFFAGTRAVGIAHAGWRGVVRGIVPHTVHMLRKRFGVSVRDIRVVIGPGIRKCHFEIWAAGRHRGIIRGNEAFSRKHGFLIRKDPKTFFDLEGLMRYQLQRAGVRKSHITEMGECTYHTPRKYFSYRRDRSVQRPRGFGNMISVIGISSVP